MSPHLSPVSIDACDGLRVVFNISFTLIGTLIRGPDDRNFILTARHCYQLNDAGAAQPLSSHVALFNYRVPCNTTSESNLTQEFPDFLQVGCCMGGGGSGSCHIRVGPYNRCSIHQHDYPPFQLAGPFLFVFGRALRHLAPGAAAGHSARMERDLCRSIGRVGLWHFTPVACMGTILQKKPTLFAL